MCKICAVPRLARYEGENLILEKKACDCQCPETVFGPKGPHCEKCEHLVPIELTDNADAWEAQPIWIDPRSKHPVRLDEVKA